MDRKQGIIFCFLSFFKQVLINNIMCKWLKESNRDKHFLYAIPVGFIFTILAVLGCASGLEFKDVQSGGKWDWLDWVATMLGGIIGQVLQLIVLFIIFK